MKTCRERTAQLLNVILLSMILVASGCEKADRTREDGGAMESDGSKAGPAGIAELRYERIEFEAEGPPTVEYPVVVSIGDEALMEAINLRIGPAGVLEAEIDDLRAAFAAGERPFDSAAAEVVYNARDILQVVWTVTATGAFTSSERRTITVDLRSGVLLGSEYMFNDDLAVARDVDRRMRPMIEQTISSLIASYPEEADMIRDMTADLAYTPELIFDAEFADNGITFVLPLDFPHALDALEPEPVRLKIGWEELKPFSYDGSILERFY